MLLNADLGETLDDRPVGLDAEVMPHIHQANIACGFHAGDPATMRDTVALALRCGVALGAHPSYPDRAGFGRRSVRMERAELISVLHYQVAALEGIARVQGATLAHVKPHGALYNDMMANDDTRAVVLDAVASYPASLPLVMQATSRWEVHAEEAAAAGVSVHFEAFADRRYRDDGLLQPRAEPGAVLSRDAMLAQVAQLCSDGTVTTTGGQVLALRAQTLCVHGDNPEGVAAIQAIRALVDRD